MPSRHLSRDGACGATKSYSSGRSWRPLCSMTAMISDEALQDQIGRPDALAVYSVRCKLIWISFRVSGSPKNRSAPLISAGARKSVEIARPKPSSCSFAKASCDPVAERGLRRWLIIWLPSLVYLRHLRHRDFGQRRGRRRQRIEQRIESGGYNELRRGDVSSGKQFNGHTATDQYSLHCWSPLD